MISWKLIQKAKTTLERERGAVRKPWAGRISVCLLYPNRYYVGMSNLGFQTVYHCFNAEDDVVCERAFLPDPEDLREEWKIEVSLFDLLEAFRQVLARVKPETFHEVMLETITVEERIQEILSLLYREKRSMAFHLLFPEQASRSLVVITFLAILELVKMKQIRVFQMAPFETIRVSPV